MMDKTDNLFTRKAFEEVKDEGLTVERKERTVVDTFVIVKGEKFGLDDLYETLSSMGLGIVITNKRMTKVLKEIGVIESEGNARACWGASKGANYGEFMDMLRELYKDEERYGSL